MTWHSVDRLFTGARWSQCCPHWHHPDHEKDTSVGSQWNACPAGHTGEEH